MDTYSLPDHIQTLVNRGALFVINHSAGKDSQAMTIRLRAHIPASQLVVIHADLGDVEWSDNRTHILDTIGAIELITCRNPRKTLLEMVEARGMWPSVGQRQCTSDLKRGPIETAIRRHLIAHPEYGGLVVSCMGIRAAESPARRQQKEFRYSPRNSKNGREWYEWLPIFDLSTEQVFEMIEAAHQAPHWAYRMGMSRLSCCFCIMASKADLRTAATLNPGLYARYVELEKRIGHTLSMSGQALEEVTGIPAAPMAEAA